MEVFSLGALAVLALIDSTSFGTLGVPVVMLVQRVVRTRVLLYYLGTICVFYFGLGLLLLAGADSLMRVLQDIGRSTTMTWAQLIAGVLLVAASFLVDKRGRAFVARLRGPRPARTTPTRRERLMSELLGDRARPRAVISAALVAGLVEAASMIPYLGAIGLLNASGLDWPAMTGILALYCVVMALPALLLLALRLAVASTAAPLLDRLSTWVQRNQGEMLAWILAIVGVVLALPAFQRLQEIGAISL